MLKVEAEEDVAHCVLVAPKKKFGDVGFSF
jgi:hypothetical protein